MKNFKSFKKSVPLLLLPFAGGAMATDVSVPLSFTTLPAITISEITPLDFGEVLSLTQAATCKMFINEGSNGTTVTPAQDGQTTTVLGAAVLAGELDAASDCSGPNGQFGVYEIVSFAGAEITVTLSPGTPTDISFVPAGYVTDLESSNEGRDALVSGAGTNVTASSDLVANSSAGTNRVIVGGTITNQVGLTAGIAYTTDFNIDVVYQ